MTAVYFIAIAAPPVGTLLSCSGSILASWEGNSVEGFVVRMEVRLEFRERLLADVRRIADHGVEASPTLTLPPRGRGGNGRMLARGPLLRFVCAVLVAVSIQRMLVGRRGVVLDRDRGLLRLEVRVEKLAAKLRLVVRAGAVGLAVLFEAAEEFADRVRGARGGLMYSICGQDAE
jgi:hypothetical protein